MSVILKFISTRMSINHIFTNELFQPTDFIYKQRQLSSSPRLQACIDTLGLDDTPFKFKKKSLVEFISWEEIFQKKQQLRADLRYELDSNNLTADMMSDIPLMYNPFSLIWTELWEYDYLNDAIEDCDKFVNLIQGGLPQNYYKITENDFVIELNNNDGTQIDIGRSLLHIFH